MPQAVAEVLHAPWTGGGLQPGVQHETTEHIAVAVCRGQQRREVGQPEIATEPQHRRHPGILPRLRRGQTLRTVYTLNPLYASSFSNLWMNRRAVDNFSRGGGSAVEFEHECESGVG